MLKSYDLIIEDTKNIYEFDSFPLFQKFIHKKY